MTALHFRLSGEGFTDLVRAVFLEGDYAKALRMIVKGLNGDGIEDIAQKILDGSHRFSGNETDGFNVEEDSDSDYQEKTRWVYAGRVKLPKKKGWFAPRALVVNPGNRDAEFARKRSSLRNQYVGTWTDEMLANRASYFTEDGEVGAIVKGDFETLGKNPMVIFEPCDPPPSWWEPIRTPADALRSMALVNRILDVIEPPQEEEVVSSSSVAPEKTLDKVREEKRQDPVFREFQFNFQLKGYRKQIRDACGDDYIPLYDEMDNVVGRVPRVPFLNYALGRTVLSDMAPTWKNISPQGLKLGSDNPDHSDAYLGAYDVHGNDLPFSYAGGYPYDGPEHRAFIVTMGKIQHEMGGFSATVLSEGEEPYVFGTVGQEILVLPNLSPDYLDRVMQAKAVITEEGGATCHLAQEAMVRNIPILRIPGAMKRFPRGTAVSVTPRKGLVQVHASVGLGWGNREENEDF